MLAKAHDTSPAAPGILPRPAKKTARHVLVVDDERLVRWSVTEALRAHGLETEEAADATSAIEQFDENCDLVLLDLHLPDSRDLRVLSLMRGKAPSVPVIVMTAYASREIADAAAALGASLIPKPFDLDDLMVAVDTALAGVAS
jgi:DNA-binding NtrC family response regulator